MSEIGKRLAYYRKLAGYTQDELSKATGVSQSAISNIEIGRNDPSSYNAAKLAAALEIPVSELLPVYEGFEPHEKKPAAENDSGLVETVRRMVLDLPDDDLLKVCGCVSGLQAARSKT